ncbi:MAG: methyltransferase domain-containing protein [Anaerolineales bacterium]|nr:methyltransferase domain-containing protein [Anaerolineales bacterium]
MSFSWHDRFLQQAAWTAELRGYLFEQSGLDSAFRVLEVGCGTGVILAEAARRSSASIHGLDLDPVRLAEARLHAPAARLTRGDALALPYPTAAFDVCLCHFLLLWVADPLSALREMKRVTRPGGHVLALAEPDYGRRQDRPAALAPLGRWQAESLRIQGADPDLGRCLAALFDQVGLRIIEAGSLQERGERPVDARERGLEWAVLEADLAGIVPADELLRLKRIDEQAWRAGERSLHIPTYFAWGQA